MNQILMTKDENESYKNSIKSIIIFFCVAIIIFALVLIGESGLYLYNKNVEKKSYIKPNLNFEKNGSVVNLIIDGEVAINKLEYYWNDGSKTSVSVEGRKNINYNVQMPTGDNKLNVIIIDVEGNRTKYEPIAVSFTEADDVVKPKISLVNTTGKITIKATDETEIDYLIYQWEGENAVKVELKSEDNKVISQEIDVQKGTKKLTVTAVDKSGNKEVISKKVVGSNGPVIKVTYNDGNFIVKVTDEFAITKIDYTLNEQEFHVENIPQGAKEFEFKVQAQEGDNYLKINAFENDLMTEYKCKKTK